LLIEESGRCWCKRVYNPANPVQSCMSRTYHIGQWLVDPSLNSVTADGETCHLEPKVMEVLVCLAEHPRETLSKEMLLKTVWPDTFVTEDVLSRSIWELRRVLGAMPENPASFRPSPSGATVWWPRFESPTQGPPRAGLPCCRA